MRVSAVVYMNQRLKDEHLEPGVLRQLADAAALPGVQDPIVGMPDLHQGYGLPIGGVMATSAEKEDHEASVVSAGAVGYDINCGVRLLRTGQPSDALGERELRALLRAIVRRIPPGIGKASVHDQLVGVGLEELVSEGAQALVRRGFGRPSDLEALEEQGCLPGARLGAVSAKARDRAEQLATLGGGNHFIELQTVDTVYDDELAEHFGLALGELTVMIHTGSRGFGHQVCSDYTSLMVRRAPEYGLALPSKGLACVPIGSQEGQDYLAAMACAVNYAFANRQLITFDVRRAFEEVLGTSRLDAVYDVAHNIAKFERHRGKRMLVHRKGATRALPAGHPGNPPMYLNTGHPALIPGSMGTGSYVTVGTARTAETYYSVNHGAGRAMSRTSARKELNVTEFHRQLGGVLYDGAEPRKVLDEAPSAYKDIDTVVESLAEIGFTKKVARLRPLAVIKGE